MSALDNVTAGGLSHPKDFEDARAELAQLRATIAEQARQLAEAREIFENIFKRDWTNIKINDKARNWLAANPAQQSQPVQEQHRNETI